MEREKKRRKQRQRQRDRETERAREMEITKKANFMRKSGRGGGGVGSSGDIEIF